MIFFFVFLVGELCGNHELNSYPEHWGKCHQDVAKTREIVFKNCKQQKNCQVPVSSEYFGEDPCSKKKFHERLQLKVEYKCGMLT